VINGGEFVLLLVIAAVVVGPERLPTYAAQLGQLVRRGRELLRDTQDRVTSELGDAGEGVDWESLDPRQYDPRRIVKEALAEGLPTSRPVTSTRPASTRPVADDEAT